jgi:hypothetical protein
LLRDRVEDILGLAFAKHGSVNGAGGYCVHCYTTGSKILCQYA